jgi:hypothetical protein
MKEEHKRAEVATPDEQPRVRNAKVFQFTPPNIDDDECPPLIDAGIYDFIYVKKWTGVLHVPKLMLRFRIVSEGPHYGKCLNLWFNVASISKKGEVMPKKGGSSKYVRMYALLWGMPARLRDMSPIIFKGKVVRGIVRTVTHDAEQVPLAKNVLYSTIETLTEVVAGA